MELKLIRDVQELDDDEIEYRNETIFHTKAWINILQNFFEQKPYIMLAHSNNNILGKFIFYKSKKKYLLTKVNSPLIGNHTPYGGPLVKSSKEVDKDKVINFLLEKYFEIINPNYTVIKLPPNENPKILEKFGFSLRETDTSLINLEKDINDLWSGIAKGTRRNIKKSEKEGVTVIVDNKGVYLDDFYNSLKSGYSDKMSIPSFEFYKTIFSVFSKNNSLSFLVALYNNKPIAFSMHLMHNKWAYAWQLAYESESRYLMANPLIKWEFMKMANVSGIKTYDLLGLDIPEVRSYKKKFGGDIIKLYHATKKTYSIGSFYNNIWGT